MTQYWILVFNQKKFDRLDDAELIYALQDANLAKLCAQYSLDGSLISPALEHLQLVTAPSGPSPISALYYKAVGQRPLFIQQWDVSRPDGKNMLAAYLKKSHSMQVAACLVDTRQIWGIVLSPTQLKDLGLVFGYEIARWAAAQGQGLVYALDGCWYRLNRHQAFLPLHAMS